MRREYSVDEVRKRMAQAVNEVVFGHSRTVITRHGKPIVALVPIEDVQRLEKMDQTSGSMAAPVENR